MNLDKDTVNAIVAKLINETKKVKKSDYEKQLRDVRLLLKNYQFLKNHINIELPEIEKENGLHDYQNRLFSLLGYRARTKEIFEFVNDVLAEYKNICSQGSIEQKRQCDIIFCHYINEHRLSYAELAIKYDMDESTVRRYEKRARQELSVMLFGIDSINDQS